MIYEMCIQEPIATVSSKMPILIAKPNYTVEIWGCKAHLIMLFWKGYQGQTAGETQIPPSSFKYNWAWKACIQILPYEFRADNEG